MWQRVIAGSNRSFAGYVFKRLSPPGRPFTGDAALLLSSYLAAPRLKQVTLPRMLRSRKGPPRAAAAVDVCANSGEINPGREAAPRKAAARSKSAAPILTTASANAAAAPSKSRKGGTQKAGFGLASSGVVMPEKENAAPVLPCAQVSLSPSKRAPAGKQQAGTKHGSPPKKSRSGRKPAVQQQAAVE